MFSKYCLRCMIQHRRVSINVNREITDFFQQNVSKTTFLNDEDGDFRIHSNEEQINRHAKTCVTYSYIPGESSSKVTFNSQPLHPVSTFQFLKKKCGKREKPCKILVSTVSLTVLWH